MRYQVVGHCAHATAPNPHGPGRVRQLHYKGMILSGDVPQEEINHLLSVGLIAPVEGTQAGQVADQPVTVDPESTDADDAEVEAKRAEARAKLPTDGSKPSERASASVWVEWLATQGYNYDDLAGLSKTDLLGLARNLP